MSDKTGTPHQMRHRAGNNAAGFSHLACLFTRQCHLLINKYCQILFTSTYRLPVYTGIHLH